MRRKILAILISMLFIISIPSVLGVTSESEDIEPCLDVGRVYIYCFVFFPQYDGYNLTFFKIRFVHYDPLNPQPEVYWFKWITIEEAHYLRIFSINKNTGYIMGFYCPSDVHIH